MLDSDQSRKVLEWVIFSSACCNIFIQTPCFPASRHQTLKLRVQEIILYLIENKYMKMKKEKIFCVIFLLTILCIHYIEGQTTTTTTTTTTTATTITTSSQSTTQTSSSTSSSTTQTSSSTTSTNVPTTTTTSTTVNINCQT